MEKVLFADADNNVFIKESNLKNFIVPREGDLVKWMNITFVVEGVIHNYDKKELLIVVHPKK